MSSAPHCRGLSKTLRCVLRNHAHQAPTILAAGLSSTIAFVSTAANNPKTLHFGLARFSWREMSDFPPLPRKNSIAMVPTSQHKVVTPDRAQMGETGCAHVLCVQSSIYISISRIKVRAYNRVLIK